MKEKIKRALMALLHAVSRNLGWKLFSLAVAVVLWFYIVSSDPTITREKVITGVDISTSGLSVLQSRDMALLTDPTTLLQDVAVRVAVPQSYYSRATDETVRVELDLSQIRQTGKQEIELTGVSSYGEVLQISPSKLEVVVETLDQRNVPVNVELIGEMDQSKYWYSIERTNPSSISVSGPSSVVRQISSARVQLDVTGLAYNYNWTVAPELLNVNGEVITQSLSKSSSSVTVGLSIYPTKQISVADSIETATVGNIPDGYAVTRVEVQPEIVTVAAEKDLLDQLETITFTPISVLGRKQSFSVTTSLNRLKDIEYLSSEQVTVTVYVEEQQTSRTFTAVPLTVIGANGRRVQLTDETVNIKVSGLFTQVESLIRGDLIAQVDVSGLAYGKHVLRPTVKVDKYPDLIFELEPASVNVTVSR